MVVLDAHNHKNKELYEGHKNFLHIVKHTGGVVESMKSVIDFKCDKLRGLTIEEIGKESIIHTGIEH